MGEGGGDQLHLLIRSSMIGRAVCSRYPLSLALGAGACFTVSVVVVSCLQAHALVARMAAGGAAQLPFPFLCLLVSGGHNLLVLVKGVGQYMQLGTTLDDALGEYWKSSGGRGRGSLSERVRL